jgi:hypothetical protein
VAAEEYYSQMAKEICYGEARNECDSEVAEVQAQVCFSSCVL